MEREGTCPEDLLTMDARLLADCLERAVWALSRARGVPHNIVRLELGLPVRAVKQPVASAGSVVPQPMAAPDSIVPQPVAAPDAIVPLSRPRRRARLVRRTAA